MRSLPEKHKQKTRKIVNDATEVAQKYLSGVFIMVICLWVLFGIGCSIVGVEGGLFFAVLCGILEIVPFVGNLLETAITILAVVAQGGDMQMELIGSENRRRITQKKIS